MLTKQLLRNALLKLLQKTPLHAISIRELCHEAGINRTTFYNHYGSQYDLLKDISQRFIDSISAHLSSEDSDDRESIHRRVATVFEYIAENRELAVLLLNNNIDPGFAERIFSLQKINELLNAALAGKNALCLCTISDDAFTGEGLTAEERQNTMTKMIEIALTIA